jgi:CheY-like chemotaxis protein
VIDGDEWTSSVLVRALKERGFDVEASPEAMLGFRKACEHVPDLVIVNPELPDIDGVWVARKMRTEVGPISKVPILFVGELPDRELRIQALNVGGDAFLARPLSNDEIVAQACALIAMARRVGPTDDAPPSSRSIYAAIRGDLSAFPLASLLMMFEMERRSGALEVVAQSGTRASLVLNEGLFSSTEVAGVPKPALDTLREVLSWRAGRFSFQPKESSALPPPRASVGALVLEAMRLEDEAKNPARALPDDDESAF